MKKVLFSCIIILLSIFCVTNTTAQNTTIKTTTDVTLTASDTYGLLNGPNGATWSYTINAIKQYSFYEYVTIHIYNDMNELIGIISDSIKVEGTNGVNQLEINPLVTKKFFNTDDNYEIMLFMHAITPDYKGKYINVIYSIAEESHKVCTIEGNNILSQNIGSYNNESYILIFHRQGQEDNTSYLYYDVYTKAEYNQNSPILSHTFKVNYANIATINNDPLPITIVLNGNKANYVIAQYEKPYFKSMTDVTNLEITPDNNFVITYYNHKFEQTNETKIKLEENSNYLYRFASLGSLNRGQDIILNYNGNDITYLISVDNYTDMMSTAIRSYYLYNTDGTLISTIFENAIESIQMSDIIGQPTQWAFLSNENNTRKLTFIDIPSLSTKAQLNLSYNNEDLSTNIDRYMKGDSYQYAIEFSEEKLNAKNETIRKIAWFNIDGTINHCDTINLGKNIETSSIYINAKALNPWLFSTDNNQEYLVSVTRSKENELIVCNSIGDILLQYCKNENSGGKLTDFYIINTETNPTLLTTFSNDNKYSLNFTSLPIIKQKTEGDGSANNPYKITSPYEFIKIEENPTAHYVIINDIDFLNVPIKGIESNFSGKLDGNNFTLKNITLDNNGLFHNINDSAIIKNIRIDSPLLNISDKYTTVGILANYLTGGLIDNSASENGTALQSYIENIHIINPKIIATNNFKGVLGGIVGEATFYSCISDCSLYNAQIEATFASSIGGIAGSISSSSKISKCLFSGNINGGNEIGGIVSMAGTDEQIKDCHINANIYGKNKIGGIIAISNRARISNCFVEGNIILDTNAKEGYIGAIAAEVSTSVEDTTELIIKNCIVNLESIDIPNNLTQKYIHRIAGYTSIDTWEYDWDKIKNPYGDRTNWPKIYGTTEKCFSNNYVISTLDPIDTNIPTDANSTEGANYTEIINNEWLSSLNYSLNKQPWNYDSSTGLILWFESILNEPEETPVDIENTIYQPQINYNGETITAQGTISIYNLNGIKIAQNLNYLSTSSIPKGIYIVVIQGEKSITQKIIVQ